jgi:hypothetical protein
LNKVRERKINARKRRIDTIRNISNSKQGHNDLVQRAPKLEKAEIHIDNHLSGASVKKNTDKGKKG